MYSASNSGKTKLLNIFIFIYYCRIFKNVRVFSKKRTKRVFVILKSPFHYKLPKHHVSYEFWTHTVQFLVPKKFTSKAHMCFKKGLVLTKPHTSRVNLKKRVYLHL